MLTPHVPLRPPQRVAWQLLDAYTSCADASFESLQATLTAGLAALSGGFAFVLHDRMRHRVVAARDRAGAQTLLWGCAHVPRCTAHCTAAAAHNAHA